MSTMIPNGLYSKIVDIFAVKNRENFLFLNLPVAREGTII